MFHQDENVKASSKCVKIVACCRLPYFNPLITVIQQQIKAIHNFDDGKFFLSQPAPHNAVSLFQRPGARARRRAATPRWRSPSPRPPPRPPRPATAPGPRPPLPLLQVSQLLLRYIHSIHLHSYMFSVHVLIQLKHRNRNSNFIFYMIYFPAVTTWTPPTTRSTPRSRAPPTRRSTTTRTTTTTTTTTTRRVEVATTPQYIHFYERPQLSDLPEQPDFYHVYNNEVGIM